MANKRISELNSLDGQISSDDLFLVQDVSPISESKSVTWGYLSTVIAASASVESSSYAITSSYSEHIISSSWASSSISSSFASSASGSGVIAALSDWAISCSYSTRADFASGSGVFAITSSYALSSSYSLNCSSSTSASYAVSASSASGSGVFATSSAYALSSSFSSTSSKSDYASNGIETGYMVLYAGTETDTIEATGNYMVCDGRDVFVHEYQNLFNSLSRKFGFYPKLDITATRTTFNSAVNVYSKSDSALYIRRGSYWTSGDYKDGYVKFVPQGSLQGCVYTVALLSQPYYSSNQEAVKILSPLSVTASFTGLPYGTYRFNITELNTQSSSILSVDVAFGDGGPGGAIPVIATTQSVSFGNFTSLTFTPESNVEYSSKFIVKDSITGQVAEGCLEQTAPGSIINQTNATLLLPDNSPFTCSIQKFSGSYNNMPSASLPISRKSLTFSGFNDSSYASTKKTLSASFFIPNMGNIVSDEYSRSTPTNINPTNGDITSSGYPYAFRYIIKT